MVERGGIEFVADAESCRSFGGDDGEVESSFSELTVLFVLHVEFEPHLDFNFLI